MTKNEMIKLAFEKVTGIPDAWTNSALMQARSGFIQGWEASLSQMPQKPVAWLEPEWGEKICPEVGYEVTMTDDHPRDLCWIPLYPKKEWVGLTDDDKVLINHAIEAEREACAKVCDVLAYHPEFASDATKLAAMAIRARG